MYQTDQYEGMIAETVTMKGHNGDVINAYLARPLGAGPFPAMLLIHHAPGWDEWYRECTRRFAHHGYVSISPNLYFRDGHGAPEDALRAAATTRHRTRPRAVPCRAGASPGNPISEAGRKPTMPRKDEASTRNHG